MVLRKLQEDCAMQDNPSFFLEKLGPGCIEPDETIQFQEAGLIKAIKAHTDIPIPVISERGIDNVTGHSYIKMLDINGNPSFGFSLEETWDLIPDPQKQLVTEQLRIYAAQLRYLTPDMMPNSRFLKDRFFWPRCKDNEFKYHSVNTDHEFIEQLIQTLKRTTSVYEPAWTAQVTRMLKSLPTGEGLVFSHGNLVPSNVFIDENANIVAILDWSQAGYYPVFWEYVKAHFWDWESPFIQDGEMDKVLTPYPLHLAALYHAKDLIW